MNRAIITLLTDFGLSDSYVAQMKGVLLSRCPECTLIDISHEVPPQDVTLASRMLAETVPKFPRNTVHLAVVDPGVGTARSILAVQWAEHLLVLPDNGLLTDLIRERPPSRVHRVNNLQLCSQQISPTFHGRDIIAPIAAFLASGGDLEQVGPTVNDLVSLSEPPQAVQNSDGSWRCRVIGKDRFGNLLLTSNQSLRQAIGAGGEFRIMPSIGNQSSDIHPTHRARAVTSYGHSHFEEFVLLFDSQNRLELAVVNGSAANMLRVAADAELRIFPV